MVRDCEEGAAKVSGDCEMVRIKDIDLKDKKVQERIYMDNGPLLALDGDGWPLIMIRKERCSDGK